MGSPDFAVPSLERLHDSGHEIAAVVSNVDKRRGRGGGASPTPVKKRARQLGLPVLEVEDLRDTAFHERLRSLEADLFVVVAFRILPDAVLEIPGGGTINLHASLLPRYRGAAPIHWAVLNGEEETGCTVFFVQSEVDTGKILLQESTPIGPEETTGDLYERLKKMGAKLLVESVDRIATGDYTLHEQDHEKATAAPKLFPEDARLDFEMPAREVHNRIRGLSPVPGAWAELDDLKFTIYRSRVGPDDTGLAPGELDGREESLLAGCGGGESVELVQVQMAGKRRMGGMDFFRGYHGTGVLH